MKFHSHASPDLNDSLWALAAMVPVALEPSPPKKRSYSDAGFDTFYPSKQRVKHHQLHWKQPDVKYEDSFCQDEETVQTVLSRSIGLALQAVGFERADPVALESFRLLTEECVSS